MLPVVDQSAGPTDQAEDQPSSSELLPLTSHPTPVAEPTPVPEPITHLTSPEPEPDNVPTEHTFEDISTGFEEVNNGSLVNTGGLGFSTGSGPVSSDRGEREGKAQMIVEETQAPKRTKEQIQQEDASLAEAIRLQNLEEEETAKQVHLNALLAKRLAEEEELTEQQKQRKAQVQFEAQHYIEEVEVCGD
ncbi:hypothetical protein Tco_0963793 [Tanacetum coccineum]